MYNMIMGLNDTPSSNRLHIAFFGRRNTGKSSLVNSFTGQNIAVVSDVKGTTTDPVFKTMELAPIGPVVIIDTPGFDDEGELGRLRVEKANQALNKTDIAVVVLENLPSKETETTVREAQKEEELINEIKRKNIPFIIVNNKSDLKGESDALNTCAFLPLHDGLQGSLLKKKDAPLEILPVSAKTGFNINLLKEKIAAIAKDNEQKKPLVSDLVAAGDFVVLVIPIDEASPKGRIILAQQQVIRGIIDAKGIAVCVRESELQKTLDCLGKKPAIVITDSQVFSYVSAVVPPEIPLTSFSILFARFKGFLETAVKAAASLDSLRENDKILICEGCTHHRQCDDIGTVKIPRLIREHTSKNIDFEFCSGGDFPQDLSPFGIVIHCGACMLNEREMQHRRIQAERQNIPFTNYGITIAHIQGILKRSIFMFNLKE